MSTIVLRTAEMDCGEVVEDKDIKGLKKTSVRLVGCAEGIVY